MKFNKWTLGLILVVAVSCAALTGCKTSTAEPGGAYAPTNQLGQVIYNDTALAMADASYKFAYEAVLGAMKFERDNRAAIAKLNPSVGASVKSTLDSIRPKVVEVDMRWAIARSNYKLNPTPAGLSTIQTILAEIQRMVPVVQSQIASIQPLK